MKILNEKVMAVKGSKKLTEALIKEVRNADNENAAVWEFPDGFFYCNTDDPGAIDAKIYSKEGILANANADTFWEIFKAQDDGYGEELENEELGWLDFNPRYETVTVMQVLLGAKELFKSIGATRADLTKIVPFLEFVEEDGEEW